MLCEVLELYMLYLLYFLADMLPALRKVDEMKATSCFGVLVSMKRKIVDLF
jgi:hypothetical protein